MEKKLVKHLSPELQLIINCCKFDPSIESIEFIRSSLNAQNLALSTLIHLANQHGILPLVYRTLKTLNEDSTLNAQRSKLNTWLTELKTSYMSIVQRNMLMSAELINILKLLKDNGIEALAFKGPTLAQMAYGDITLRQYGDLDIYVHKEDIAQAAKVLLDNHYIPSIELQYFSNEAYLNVENDGQFYNKNESVLIEVHWTVFLNTFSKKMKIIDLWDNPVKIMIQNFEFATFKTELLILYLCMHGSKHMWERIEWIADVDRLIRVSSDINWREIYAQAQAVDGKTMLDLGLFLSLEQFGTPLPEEIKNNLNKNKKVWKLSSDVLRILNKQEYFSNTELQKNYRHFHFHFSLRDHFQNKFHFIFEVLFPLKPRDIVMINLPRGLYFIYYFLRPFRLANKYIKNLFK